MKKVHFHPMGTGNVMGKMDIHINPNFGFDNTVVSVTNGGIYDMEVYWRKFFSDRRRKCITEQMVLEQVPLKMWSVLLPS